MAIEKEVFEGYIPKQLNIVDLLCWWHNRIHLENETIWRKKGKKDDWGDDHWPPKKVKITVEIEDDPA